MSTPKHVLFAQVVADSLIEREIDDSAWSMTLSGLT
jgi:hypothetical protein